MRLLALAMDVVDANRTSVVDIQGDHVMNDTDCGPGVASMDCNRTVVSSNSGSSGDELFVGTILRRNVREHKLIFRHPVPI